MAKKNKPSKKEMLKIKLEINKWQAIAAWAIPATGIVEIAKILIKHFLHIN